LCAVGQPASTQGCANANARLTFSFSITPSSGALLPASAVAAPAVTAQVAASFATLLSVPASTVAVTSVTDLATGASIYFPLPAPAKGRRALSGAPGSLGCSVNVSIDLGTSGTLSTSAKNALAQLATPGAALASFFGPILSKAAQAANVAAGALTPGLAAGSISSAAAFTVPQPAVAKSDSGGGGGAGPAAGGAVGGIVVLVLAFWSWRSYSKHGSLPCCRNRKKEESDRKAKAMEAAVTELARRQAEAGSLVIRSKAGGAAAAGGGAADAAFGAVNPITVARAGSESSAGGPQARATFNPVAADGLVEP
jgi:hypothetical protein